MALDARKIHAARLRAQELTQAEIAEKVGLCQKTIERYEKDTDYQLLVAEFQKIESLRAKDGNQITLGTTLPDLSALPLDELANITLRAIIAEGSDANKLRALQLITYLDSEKNYFHYLDKSKQKEPTLTSDEIVELENKFGYRMPR